MCRHLGHGFYALDATAKRLKRSQPPGPLVSCSLSPSLLPVLPLVFSLRNTERGGTQLDTVTPSHAEDRVEGLVLHFTMDPETSGVR